MANRRTHRGARKATSSGASISHAARHALAAKGMKICKRKTPSAYNRKVGACMRGKGGSTSAFRACAKKAAGKSYRKGKYD